MQSTQQRFMLSKTVKYLNHSSSFPDDDDASTLNAGEYDYNNEYGHSGGFRQGLTRIIHQGYKLSFFLRVWFYILYNRLIFLS